MVNQDTMTLDEIRTAGLKILRQELGIVGLVRFLQMFETGYGDYTQERSHWLGEPDVNELLADYSSHLDKDAAAGAR